MVHWCCCHTHTYTHTSRAPLQRGCMFSKWRETLLQACLSLLAQSGDQFTYACSVGVFLYTFGQEKVQGFFCKGTNSLGASTRSPKSPRASKRRVSATLWRRQLDQKMVPGHKMDPKPLKWSHTLVGLAPHKAPLHGPYKRHTNGVLCMLIARAGLHAHSESRFAFKDLLKINKFC